MNIAPIPCILQQNVIIRNLYTKKQCTPKICRSTWLSCGSPQVFIYRWLQTSPNQKFT